MDEHIIKNIDRKMVKLANGKGTFILDIVLTEYRQEPKLNEYLIRTTSLDGSVVMDWMEIESKDPAFDFADLLVSNLLE
ncbi:hypothetical protein [Oceanobacillus sp. FSL H7-0719]|uniref:hypothetical protein n=1 Tax=Oceanobacillus sp. FSL H7-0719 TaxID=2954507 RepID=UPI00324F138E